MRPRNERLRWKITIQTKLMLTFVSTTVIILAVNLFMYFSINNMIKQLDMIYKSNIVLNELAEALVDVQTNMTDYLNTKSSDAMEEYYRSEQNYSELIGELNHETTNNNLLLMEKNIYNMSESYLEITNQTVEAKRGRNVEKYKIRYEKATDLHDYISTYIYSLNNEQFRSNSSNYQVLSFSLHYMEMISIFILIVVAIYNIILISLVTRSIINPLKILAKVANEVAESNFNVKLLEVHSNDEVGVVSKAFNKMLINIREYIERIRDSMEMERKMKEKELMMETHLKDAQLKYLQAQINPHFLFNTLNAGAQLAMMEGAERTYMYVQNVAEFFRYNVKKNNDIVTLKEEIELVDNYIYILNVRFSGDIHFVKEIDETLTKIQIPSMILQPIVENAVNYGIRDIEWQGIIVLKVYSEKDMICISIKDNGIGMSQEKINQVISNELREVDLSKDSNGIGLDNVIGRLRLFFDIDNTLEIISEGESMGTEIIIHIPNTERNTVNV
ncbi:MAG TPA: histidine kinase [Lachnospiraceae bacterium]|nr:histidine kinase [Lachnospiraceae bacterium]